MDFKKITEKARHSDFYLWLLNVGLKKMVPFNAPHKLRVARINENEVEVHWPYIRKNLNHIKGLHACGLATLTEFVSGFSILRKLPPNQYRIIMKTLQMEYHYQGKTDAVAIGKVDDEFMKSKIYEPVAENGQTEVESVIKTLDKNGNHLSTGTIVWQVKSWDKVKTKL